MEKREPKKIKLTNRLLDALADEIVDKVNLVRNTKSKIETEKLSENEDFKQLNDNLEEISRLQRLNNQLLADFRARNKVTIGNDYLPDGGIRYKVVASNNNNMYLDVHKIKNKLMLKNVISTDTIEEDINAIVNDIVNEKV